MQHYNTIQTDMRTGFVALQYYADWYENGVCSTTILYFPGSSLRSVSAPASEPVKPGS